MSRDGTSEMDSLTQPQELCLGGSANLSWTHLGPILAPGPSVNSNFPLSLSEAAELGLKVNDALRGTPVRNLSFNITAAGKGRLNRSSTLCGEST